MNPTRGRASKIDLLPDALRNELHKLLREKKNTQVDILEAINELIQAEGLGAEATLSLSGLNRYATNMEKVGQRIRESRVVSEQWVKALGTKSTGEVSTLLIEMVRTIAFDSVMKLSEEDAPIEPKVFKDLAMGIERLERAASENQKRELEWRKAFAVEVAAEVETTARAQGLTDETVQIIKNRILGVA